VLIAVAIGYFAICWSLSLLGRRLERRSARELRPRLAPIAAAGLQPEAVAPARP